MSIMDNLKNGIKNGLKDAEGDTSIGLISIKINRACDTIIKKISLSQENCDVIKLRQEIDDLITNEFSDSMDRYIKSKYPNSKCTFIDLVNYRSNIRCTEKAEILREFNNVINNDAIIKIDAYTVNRYGVSVREDLEEIYPRTYSKNKIINSEGKYQNNYVENDDKKYQNNKEDIGEYSEEKDKKTLSGIIDWFRRIWSICLIFSAIYSFVLGNDVEFYKQIIVIAFAIFIWPRN